MFRILTNKDYRLGIRDKHILEKLMSGNEIRNVSTRHGVGPDIAGLAKWLLDKIGLSVDVHYTYENDAPRGGWAGFHTKLTDEGLAYFGNIMSTIKEQIKLEHGCKDDHFCPTLDADVKKGVIQTLNSILRLKQ